MRHKNTWLRLLIFAVLVSLLAGPVMAMVAKDEVSITGTAEQTGAGFVITADDGQYLVIGQDLTAMLGKRVRANGIISEQDGVKTIKVSSIEEL